MRTLEKTRRLHREEIKSAFERQAHEESGSGLVFLRRSRADPARPPGSGRAWSGPASGSVRLPSAGAVVGPRATESRAAARSGTNSNKGASLLARNTSRTVGSTLQKINLPPFCRASRCKATKLPSDADPAKPTPPRSSTNSGRPFLRRCVHIRAQVLYRGRVESPTIPELRDQDPFMLIDLNRGLQHGSPVQKEEEKRSKCSSFCGRIRSGRYEKTYEQSS